MKKLLLSIVFVVVTVAMLFAQTPQMTYQAVIRDANGKLLTNRSVSATVKIMVGGSELFTQTYTETTNVHGLLTVTFGNAGFATIDWANASISCEVYNGTDVYIAENFQPVTAVPLAIKAITESDPQFNASVASDITAADTLYWNHKLDAEVDSSVTNELQVLSISKDTIYLSNGGFVKLPAVIDTTSLDDAYNHGSEIIADSGPVTINGTDGLLATGTYNSGTIPASGAGVRMMWYPGRAAFRAGYINDTQWDDANVGHSSTAMGNNTTAKGMYSTAMGLNTTASGVSSTAMGKKTVASGVYSTAMGDNTTATGKTSTALGVETKAQAYASVVLGKHNIIAGNITQWVATDPIFVIGNGTDTNNRSNALTVYKNGNMDINGVVTATGGNSTNWNTAYGWGNHTLVGYLTSYSETDPAFTAWDKDYSDLINTPTRVSAFTNDVGYMTAWDLTTPTTSLDDAYNYGSFIIADSGAVTINGTDGFLATGTLNLGTIPVSGAGIRMMWYPRKAAFRAGYVTNTQWDDINIGQASTAMGLGTTASGQASTALGLVTTAIGQASTAMGIATTASGHFSTAMGSSTTASGYCSNANGVNTTASGHASTAMGANTIASGIYSIAIGYNTISSGDYSIALGDGSIASSFLSTALGFNTRANAPYSTTMGLYTISAAYASVVLGRYNLEAGHSDGWYDADPLFVIGNGTDASNRSNALTVYKNGNMDVNGNINVNGIVTDTSGNSTNWNTAYSWGNHASAGYLTAEVDGSVSNELQALSISHDTVYLSNGGFVKLPTADGSETKVTAGANVSITGNGTTASPYVVNAIVSMTQMVRDALTPTEGMFIYNTTMHKPNYYNGTEWMNYDGTVAKKLEIGDSLQGGIITYILQPGDPGYDANVLHGIIAAPSDQSTGAGWGCWGTMISATSVLILTGAANTNAIVAGCSETGAAKLCDDLSLNTYTDWYLPSLYELGLMYTNLHTQGLGDFDEGTYYWSSSEDGYYKAWSFNFSNVEYDTSKNNSYRVRAVRSF